MKKAIIAALVVTALNGASIADGNFDLKVTAPAAKGSEKAVAKISVQPKGAYHMNVDYPTKLTISATDGVAIENAKQTGKDAVKFTKESAEFGVAYTCSAKGTKSLAAELKFALCTDSTCEPQVKQISIDVECK